MSARSGGLTRLAHSCMYSACSPDCSSKASTMSLAARTSRCMANQAGGLTPASRIGARTMLAALMAPKAKVGMPPPPASAFESANWSTGRTKDWTWAKARAAGSATHVPANAASVHHAISVPLRQRRSRCSGERTTDCEGGQYSSGATATLGPPA